MYDFLLVINSNLGPMSHRYWDTATYWLKIANISHPSHLALVRGYPLRIYGESLRFLKLESSRQPMVKIWRSYLAPFLTDPPVWQTDGRTDRWTELRSHIKTPEISHHIFKDFQDDTLKPTTGSLTSHVKTMWLRREVQKTEAAGREVCHKLAVQ